MKRVVFAVAVVVSLAGCAGGNIAPSSQGPEPVGIGTGVHEFKKSPCACNELRMSLPDGDFKGVILGGVLS